jgi:hypothetical protein
MDKKWFILIPFGIAAFIILGGFAVMFLWNWLLPPLFGWPLVSFWQALGILALSRILFGGFGMHGGRHGFGMRHRLKHRWEHMTPEEREQFEKGLHSHHHEEKAE